MAAGVGIDPIAIMRARLEQGDAPPMEYANAPAGVPPTSAPAAGPPVGEAGPPSAPGAPAPSPVAGFNLGGIGSALGRAFSGEGILNTGAGSDETLDPVTGAPKGLGHRSNMQSLLKTSLLLIAAGQPQSPESRAAILSKMGGAIDGADTLNGFAKNRIEMAKLKLIERQVLQDQAIGAAVNARLGGGAPASATGLPGGPAATTGAPTGGVAPVTPPPVVATGPAPAPVEMGVPTEALPPDQAAAEREQIAAMPAPAVPGDPATTGSGTKPPDPALALPTKAPPPPPELAIPWRNSPNYETDSLAIRAQSTPREMAAELAKREEAWNNREVRGAPYINAGAVVQDVYKNGRVVSQHKVRDVPNYVTEEADPNGGTRIVTRDPILNRPTAIQRERDVEADEGRKATVKVVESGREALDKTYKEVVRPGIENAKKLQGLQDVLDRGEAITGPFANWRSNMVVAMAKAGMVNDDTIRDLVNTKQIDMEAGIQAGKFAKAYTGPQISNYDIQNAMKIVGLDTNGDPRVIRQAMERIITETRGAIKGYKEDADRHHRILKKTPHLDTEAFSVPDVKDEIPERTPLQVRTIVHPKTGKPVKVESRDGVNWEYR